MSPRLLRLYPAEFRRAFGDEIAEAYREATEGAGRLSRLREGFELWRFAVPVVVALALAGRGAVSGVRTAGQFALAVAPFLALGHFSGVVGEANAVPCLVLLSATGLAVRLWRRRNSGTPGHA
ncbi:hypothetical protein ACFVJ8_23405 [Streptomyces yangpuensis]|uniref:hypothetical protein n=1 Tax=Streptomyces yangpuensis TaxID=1648182 RepID=UPI0036276D3D